MTVAFFYFSLNILILLKSNLDFTKLFRPTLGCIYLFAGLNKLSPGFRTGKILVSYLPEWLANLSTPLAYITIGAEVALGLGIFLEWGGVKWLSLILHTSILIFIPTDSLHFFNLAIYGCVMVLAVFLLSSPPRRIIGAQ